MRVWTTPTGDTITSLAVGPDPDDTAYENYIILKSLYDAGYFGDLPEPKADPLNFKDVKDASYKYGNNPIGHLLDLYRAGKISKEQLVKEYTRLTDQSTQRYPRTPEADANFNANSQEFANREATKMERNMGPGGQNNFMMASVQSGIDGAAGEFDPEFNPEIDLQPEPNASPESSFDEGMQVAIKDAMLKFQAGDLSEKDTVDAFINAGFDPQEAQDAMASLKAEQLEDPDSDFIPDTTGNPE